MWIAMSRQLGESQKTGSKQIKVGSVESGSWKVRVGKTSVKSGSRIFSLSQLGRLVWSQRVGKSACHSWED